MGPCRYILRLIFLLPFFYCCNPNKSNVQIDKTIGEKVEKIISSNLDDKISYLYYNRTFFEIYENDSIVKRDHSKKADIPFKSFFHYRDKSLIIDGMYGLFGGVGFSLSIKENVGTVKLVLDSDEFPNYASTEDSNPVSHLAVECLDPTIILSQIPSESARQPIWGFVEFKSKDFYELGDEVYGENIIPRNKKRINMKIYFRAEYLDTSE